MGFDWSVSVFVAYIQPVLVTNCYSRFAARCLTLRADPQRSGLPSAKKAKIKKLPGENLPEPVDWDEPVPFSEDECEVERLNAADREVYEKLKQETGNDHANPEAMNMNCDQQLVKHCFRVAVERLLPGHSDKFDLCFELSGGAWGECGEGATEEHAYIEYKPSACYAGAGLDVGRGGVNVPWGNRLTPISGLNREEQAQVDASFAVLMDKLGLDSAGAAGLYLVSEASGG